MKRQDRPHWLNELADLVHAAEKSGNFDALWPRLIGYAIGAAMQSGASLSDFVDVATVSWRAYAAKISGGAQ